MTLSRVPIAALVCAAPLFAAPAAQACGPQTDCTLETGTYRARVPAGEIKGAIVFFHGWRGSAEAEMRNGSLARVAMERDLVLIAPDGLAGTWAYPGSPSDRRDEFAYLAQVMADAEARWGVTRDRTMVSGFSMGASMAWNVACYMDGFAGYAPIAGAFWDPIPEACPAGVPVMTHVHGLADRTVPLAGRPIGDGHRQSDVKESLAMWRRQGACEPYSPSAGTDRLACSVSTCGDAPAAGALELCLHEGGHSIRAEWVARGWDALAERYGW